MDKTTDIILYGSMAIMFFVNAWLWEIRFARLSRVANRYIAENHRLYVYCLEIILSELIKDEKYEEAAKCKKLLEYYKTERQLKS